MVALEDKRSELNEVFDSVIEARERVLGYPLDKRNTIRDLILVTRDFAEMLGYFKSYKTQHISAAFRPLIKAALASPFGHRDNPFEESEYSGKKLTPGFRIEFTKWELEEIMRSKEALDITKKQRIYNDILYTGCLVSFPKFEEYDTVRVSIPQIRLSAKVKKYHYIDYETGREQFTDLLPYDNEEAEVIEDSPLNQHMVKLHCLDETIMLPKNYLYHVY